VGEGEHLFYFASMPFQTTANTTDNTNPHPSASLAMRHSVGGTPLAKFSQARFAIALVCNNKRYL